jgi:hypothetical protein
MGLVSASSSTATIERGSASMHTSHSTMVGRSPRPSSIAAGLSSRWPQTLQRSLDAICGQHSSGRWPPSAARGINNDAPGSQPGAASEPVRGSALEPRPVESEHMPILVATTVPVNAIEAEAAYRRATAAVDARLAQTSDPNDALALALIAAEEAAYEAFFHAKHEQQRRMRMHVAGEFTTDAKAVSL